jgi:hypothetical protein
LEEFAEKVINKKNVYLLNLLPTWLSITLGILPVASFSVTISNDHTTKGSWHKKMRKFK